MATTKFDEALSALAPLRVRAQQLQVQATRDRDDALQRWSQSEKPVLKEHAAGMKQTMQLLAKEEEALQHRVLNLSASTVKNNPGTSTGFNVIRARVDAFGRPLSTEALQAERDRLRRTLDTLDFDIAGAKAEINQHRRSEEADIWETKLVALQDTKRVYNDEINLIEVELLGREHYERMQRDRQVAEETGAAQLQRLQENILQTRQKYNRAKHQYYFPLMKGFNITFGGGGIFGACKDICISEIHGAMKITMEPGGLGEDGTFRMARMVVQVEAPTAATRSGGEKAAAKGGGGGGGSRRLSPTRKPSFAQRRTDSVSSSGGGGGVRPTSAPNKLAGGQSSSNQQPLPLQQRKSHVSNSHSEKSLAANHQSSGVDSLTRRSVSFPAAHSSASASTATPPHPSPLPSSASGLPPSGKLPKPAPGATGSGKTGFASRFMTRLSNRKERFQGKGLPHLQPARDEDDMTGTVNKQKRSLASKLLSRSSKSSGGGGVNSNSSKHLNAGSEASLDRLAFGGHELTDVARRGSMMSTSIDEDASARLSESVAGSDYDEYSGLEAVMEGDCGPSYDGTNSSNDDSPPQIPTFAGLVLENDEGDGSLASDDDEDDDIYADDDHSGNRQHYDGQQNEANAPSPLTKETLQRASSSQQQQYHHKMRNNENMGAPEVGESSSGHGSGWNRGDFGPGADAMSVLDDGNDGTSSVFEFNDEDAAEAAAAAGLTKIPKGVYVMGRLAGFELIGERGTKVPNLTIGKADVRATCFARFVFEYSKQHGWRPGTQRGDRPVFYVDKLKYTIKGNNVPMPPTLIKHILRIAIPGLIQRRLLNLFPKEFGEYLLTAKKGLEAVADVGVVGPALDVLDADLGFEVRGPARSAKDARHQQALYAAAKEARNLLGLSLPQAQVLAELFNGSAALLDPPRPASIAELINFQATYERFPKVYRQLCGVMDTAYHVLAQAHGRPEVADFSFSEFMAGPVRKMRRKPARTRVVVQSMDVGINADAVVTAIHDFTQRAIEEMIVKGPLLDPGSTLHSMKETVVDELEVLHAWHAFALRELQHFKSKFRGAAGTVLAAADCQGFSGGVENCFYEGPLRLRFPLNIKLDQDGAFSFDLPLPSPAGKLGVFMDNFKALTVPSHLRPPSQAVNWIELTGDSEVDSRMKEQMSTALGLIQGVLDELGAKIVQNELEKDDEDANKVLSQPRTLVGDRLGRMFVNRLKVRVRLDERRIGEILSGLDGTSMGGEGAFNTSAGRIIGHLGDVMTLALTPAGGDASAPAATAGGPPAARDRYLFHFESSDISRLRADVQSLGFQSAVTPGGIIRLLHAVGRAVQLAFKERPPEELEGFRDQMKGWYNLLTREDLNVSVCVDTAGEVEDDQFMVKLSGKADEDALRATSPLVLTNEIDLVPLGKLMRGDVDKTFPPEYSETSRK
ncbi:hypothetical protein Ndes2526B_g09687 [Nannochloris sp. 'desiccata']|nr:hypothetical protein NADE_007364 [Chlorella desiccata (nom. nud.)]KAH7615844.1 hypothetical protein NADE_007633 [Chlorella desiccata (nom. nud.)]KAH7615846.1 hypothetical protein NADE_007635 [Chlorella desiccata (nom. nud.)]